MEASSSNTLLYVLIGVGVVVLLAVVGLAVWLAKRNSSPAPSPGYAGQFGPQAGGPMPAAPPMPAAAPMPAAPPMPQAPPSPHAGMAPGWYPDPQQQARLRWFDGHQWTANTQN